MNLKSGSWVVSKYINVNNPSGGGTHKYAVRSWLFPEKLPREYEKWNANLFFIISVYMRVPAKSRIGQSCNATSNCQWEVSAPVLLPIMLPSLIYMLLSLIIFLTLQLIIIFLLIKPFFLKQIFI